MKVSTKMLLTLVGAAGLFSCSRDYSIEKNLDVSWEIDKSIVNDDIRERIGYDPRFTYPYILQNEKSVNVYSISQGETETFVNTTYSTEVKVELSKRLTTNETVALEFDADLYNSLKEKYGEEYQLANPAMLTLDASEKVISAGQTAVFFTISYKQSGNLEKNLIAPFVLKYKGNSPFVKTLDSAQNVVLKLQKKALEFNVFPFNGKVLKTAGIEEGRIERNSSHYFEFGLATESNIPFDILVKPVFNSNYVPAQGKTLFHSDKLSNLGLSRTLSSATNMVNFTIPFDVTDQTEPGFLVAPFTFVATIGEQEIPLPFSVVGEVQITQGTRLPILGNIATVSASEVAGLSEISKTGMVATSVPVITAVTLAKMLDGKDLYGALINTKRNPVLTLNLNGEKLIKTIRIKCDSDIYALKRLTLLASNTIEQDVEIATIEQNSDNVEFVFRLSTPIKATHLKFKNLKAVESVSNGFINIREIYFYEE